MQQTPKQATTAPLQLYVNTETDDPLAGILTARGIEDFHMIQEEPKIPHQETDHDPTENPFPNMIFGKRDVETSEYCKTYMVYDKTDPLQDNCPWTAGFSSPTDQTPYITQIGLHMPGVRDDNPTSPWSSYERSWNKPPSGYTYSSNSQIATPYLLDIQPQPSIFDPAPPGNYSHKKIYERCSHRNQHHLKSTTVLCIIPFGVMVILFRVTVYTVLWTLIRNLMFKIRCYQD